MDRGQGIRACLRFPCRVSPWIGNWNSRLFDCCHGARSKCHSIYVQSSSLSLDTEFECSIAIREAGEMSEDGVGGYFVGVPCVLGKDGVEKVIELKLDGEERKMFDASVSHVKELVGWVEKNWA
ncbi:MAG: hypothetical protein IPK83_24355 [Planctomycetes bacterium]|nr:hypothetical protein [Planctomycetota bacterium]